MPAKGHAKKGALRHPKKTRFTDGEAARLAVKAKERGLTEAAFLRQSVLAVIGADAPLPPSAGAGEKPVDRVRRGSQAKAYFSDEEELRIAEYARAAGLTTSAFLRAATLAAIGAPSTVKPKSKRKGDDDVIAALHRVDWQLRKIGININQLAHQANLQLLPLTTRECDYLKNIIQLTMSATISAMERIS
ncbi:plasmid mobilization protein [Hyphomicrobium sp. DY-1]|uniref:plasmid mobilization protein n=1 Tax=Hyphomicrobium sp. DY-1 TaxID=3075650 RepID=UPI0039C31C5D